MTTPDAPTPERIVRFTVDMPESLHEQLSQKAAQCGKKKAMLVRLAIAQTLKD
jgi:predicted DNA-binding protein